MPTGIVPQTFLPFFSPFSCIWSVHPQTAPEASRASPDQIKAVISRGQCNNLLLTHKVRGQWKKTSSYPEPRKPFSCNFALIYQQSRSSIQMFCFKLKISQIDSKSLNIFLFYFNIESPFSYNLSYNLLALCRFYSQWGKTDLNIHKGECLAT